MKVRSLLTLGIKMLIISLLQRITKPDSKGGETASTGIKKLGLHTEVPFARKTDGLKTNADDYAYALAA